MTSKKPLVGILVILLIHLVGIGGFIVAGRDFMVLTPLNLLVSSALLFYYHSGQRKVLFSYSLFVVAVGFIIEWAGVKTGLIFGKYTYDNNLGPLWLDVPVIIGINWLLLSYSSAVVAQRIWAYCAWPPSAFKQSLGAALLMVLVDLFIEPVAASCGFWHWENNTIPAQNFVSWFVFSFCFTGLFTRLKINTDNNVAPGLYLIQLLFFVAIFLLR